MVKRNGESVPRLKRKAPVSSVFRVIMATDLASIRMNGAVSRAILDPDWFRKLTPRNPASTDAGATLAAKTAVNAALSVTVKRIDVTKPVSAGAAVMCSMFPVPRSLGSSFAVPPPW